jgi:hypothetical protein
MQNDLTIQPVAASHAANDAASEAKTPTAQPYPEPKPEPVAHPMPIANPTLRFNAALGLLVIEFFNNSGAVTTSIPSQRQIQEYQKWNATHIGQNSAALPEASAPVPATTKASGK